MEKMKLAEARTYRTRIQNRRWLSEHAFELILARPDGFAFMPGQRIHLNFGDIGRDYSIVSSPGEESLRLCIRHVPQGQFTPKLRDIPVGESLQFLGPNGYFLFRGSEKRPIFVATGTGVAPFVSMCLAGHRGFTLLHGVRSPDERYYADVLKRTADTYMSCITGPVQSRSSGYAGRVTEYIAHELPAGNYDFYLCGRAEMIRDVTHIVDQRFPDSRVFIELFF